MNINFFIFISIIFKIFWSLCMNFLNHLVVNSRIYFYTKRKKNAALLINFILLAFLILLLLFKKVSDDNICCDEMSLFILIRPYIINCKFFQQMVIIKIWFFKFFINQFDFIFNLFLFLLFFF